MAHRTARWLSAAALVTAGALAFGRIRLDRRTTRRVADLLAAADSPASSPYRREDVADLPPPVRRYFERVLSDGAPHVRTARLEQRGEFRLGGRSGSWRPLSATQHYAVDPPGFVWDADIRMFPFVSARVVDAYERGRGSLRATVLSAVPVAEAESGPALDEAELQRYLAEAVWFPTALLPAAGVEWEPRDDRSARATVADRGTEASLVFHFDADGLVTRVVADERYRQEDDSYERWTGRFDAYERRDGMLIPTEASVEWNLPGGDLPYWRAALGSVGYRRD